MSPDLAQIEETIRAYYEAGRRRDFGKLSRLKASQGFSKFDDLPPLGRQGAGEALAYEELAFSSISDLQYEIRDLEIQPLSEDHALATFYLRLRGVVVENYTFEGRGVARESRVTMVLRRESGEWRILHLHASPMAGEKGV